MEVTPEKCEQEVEVSDGKRKLKLRGSETIITMLLLVIIGLSLWTIAEIRAHKDVEVLRNTNLLEAQAKLTSALVEQARWQRETWAAQREGNCLLALDQKDRQRNLEVCRRASTTQSP